MPAWSINKKNLIVSIIGLAIGCSSLLFWGLRSTAPPAPPPKIFQVKTVISQAHAYTPRLRLSGYSEANRYIILRSQVDATVLERQAEVGTLLEEGTSLLTMDKEGIAERYEEAKALVDQRELEYTAAKKLVSQSYKATTKLSEAEAQLKSAQAQLANAKKALDNTHLPMPFTGMLHQYHVNKGDYVRNGDSLADVIEVNPMTAIVWVTAAQHQAISRQQQAYIDLGDGRQIEGTVISLEPRADVRTRMFKVKIAFPNPDHRILDQRSIIVELPLKPQLAHHFSPAILTLDDSGKLGVRAVNEVNKVAFYPAQIISHTKDKIYLTGLPETLQVIIRGQDFVTPGQEVLPVKEERGP